MANALTYTKALPGVAKLVWNLVRDNRVPKPLRAGFIALIAYVVLPVDIVPDWLPFSGQIDDVVVVTFGLRQLLRRVPSDVLREHWSGSVKTLEQVVGRPV